MTMLMYESLEESYRQVQKRTSSRVSSRAPSSTRAPRERSPKQQSESPYTVFKRDILCRAIDENQLLGSKLSEYTDLLTRLDFDLTPLVSHGQTWYFCRGKQHDGSACRRMIPEAYLRTAVGKILRAADKPDLEGDDLVEELATALSYAICSEHHRKIHRVARAIDCRKHVEQWRSTKYPATPRRTTPSENDQPSSLRLDADDTSGLSSPGTEQPPVSVHAKPEIKDIATDLVERLGALESMKAETDDLQYW